ncbi:MAG: type II toxin-antitoxin system RelE/ParE family toxin [Nitrospirae bacterium]|nr:type II toxin-antitoxin system RelE/ParE family toxin [Nitrospirota bacterium]
MIPYGFHPEARSEFHESARYYEFQQCGLGYRFVDAVRDAIQRIRSHPLLYREVEQGFRQCRVVRFPFGIIYRFNKEKVEIIAVMHLRRKPGYWKERQTVR